MRISSGWIQQLGVNSMLNQQSLVSQTQMQLSTGLRVLTPADDPGGAVGAQIMTESLKTTQQYQTNLTTAQGRLQLEDSALDSVDTLLQRIKEVAVRGLNDTLTASDRQALGDQTQQYLDEITGLANTKNANGEYIFGGYRTDTPPYVFDDQRTPPSYVYQGGQQQRSLRIGDLRNIEDGDTGFRVFEDVPSTAGKLGIANVDGKQSLLNTVYTLAQALKGDLTGTHGTLTGTANLAGGKDYSAGPASFDLAVDGGTAETITIPAQNYPSAQALADAINTQISAGPLRDKVAAQVSNGAIQFASVQIGPNASVTVSQGTPGFLADAGLADPSTGTGSTTEFHATASAALADIDTGLERVLDIRASVGARLNALDEQDSLQSKFIIDTQANLSKVQDLDYAEAISRFSQQQTVLQASMTAFSQVQKLSLFNYL
ncbi:flagellar hook-associated protein 3 FlgL [Methylomagnum ishizawai]|uniref:Flagellar hook-associated protein 3 FlgL n=1 Tax=Methylomagnum ishizawai TaxID=1760988 RepID=A0A1Y6CZR2_9GAMM|nr:flagellar hook-associated protein FlgL [Methylomagnum ishizawai]SMF95806.1 flagellar hook-associated protein 3 FlgL [Methylomagnum ishizawai]